MYQFTWWHSPIDPCCVLQCAQFAVITKMNSCYCDHYRYRTFSVLFELSTYVLRHLFICSLGIQYSEMPESRDQLVLLVPITEILIFIHLLAAVPVTSLRAKMNFSIIFSSVIYQVIRVHSSSQFVHFKSPYLI